MKRAAAPLLALLIAGCSSPSPDATIMEPGTPAVVSKPDGVYLNVVEARGDFVQLPPGTRLTVGYDPGSWTPDKEPGRPAPKTYVYPEENSKLRDIDVVVESGSFTGKAGKLCRKDVRPAPR